METVLRIFLMMLARIAGVIVRNVIKVFTRRRAKLIVAKKLIAKGYKEETKDEIHLFLEKHFLEKLIKNPNDIEIRTDLAVLYSRKQNHREALRQWKIVSNLDPKNVEVYRNMGNACSDMKNYREAIRHYRKAVTMDPHYAAGHNLMGAACFQAKEYRQAMKCWEKALRIEPDNGATYHCLGMASYMQHKLYDAIAYFQKAALLGYEDSQEWLQKNGYGW
jgi:tetratricopeptide (TPR) repeat protein